MKNKSPSKQLEQQSADEKVKIVIRLRPILNDEDATEFVELEDVRAFWMQDHTLKIMKPGSLSYMRFSNILSSQSTQSDVFELVKDSIYSFMKGVNNTVFAYGQTGAGKTYSIIGDYSHLDSRDNLETYLMGSSRGILSRALEMILQEIKKSKDKDAKVYLSFFEIYNEKIFDLYNNISSSPLDIRQSKNGEISIPDLKQVEVNNIGQAISYLSIGLKNRATGSTHANSKSSRSHSIFQILYERTSKLTDTFQSSSLRVVDLAGSEKFKIPSDLSPQQRQIRIQELTSINGSLSCLGHCISALIDKSRTHIPFRNSKLTRILSDSLIGQGRMKFIVCISPSMSANAETFSTLQFANRAKRAIVDRSPSKQHNLSKKSSTSEDYLLLKSELEKERQLRAELQQQLKVYQNTPGHNPYEAENKILRKENADLREKLKYLTLELESRTTMSMKSSNCQSKDQQKLNLANQHKGLLKLPVFKQNNQITNQPPPPQPLNHTTSQSKNKKKLEFENKMKKFIENQSPPSKSQRQCDPDYSFNYYEEYREPPFEKVASQQVHQPHIQSQRSNANQQTFEIYDEHHSAWRSDQLDYDSNVNFIENTCKNMKVQCLANLKEQMQRAKKQLQHLQEKDTYLERRYADYYAEYPATSPRLTNRDSTQ